MFQRKQKLRKNLETCHTLLFSKQNEYVADVYTRRQRYYPTKSNSNSLCHARVRQFYSTEALEISSKAIANSVDRLPRTSVSLDVVIWVIATLKHNWLPHKTTNWQQA